jgi:hypothetical protein
MHFTPSQIARFVSRALEHFWLWIFLPGMVHDMLAPLFYRHDSDGTHETYQESTIRIVNNCEWHCTKYVKLGHVSDLQISCFLQF